MKKITTRILTYTGGLIVAFVVVGVILRTNPQLRQKAKKRTEELIEVSRVPLEKIQKTFSEAQDMVGIISNQKEQRLAGKEAAALAAYDDDWNKHIWEHLSRPS